METDIGITVNGSIEKDKDLAPLTWFKVGGKAEYFYTPSSIADLQEFFKQAPTEMPITTVGNFSNVLIRDGGIKGFVVKLDGQAFKNMRIEHNTVEVGAGALNRSMCLEACKLGLSGLEFLSDIPGTVGGAIKMNAGAYGKEIKDVLISCRVMNRAGDIHILEAKDIDFTYRKASFQSDVLIISAIFKVIEKPSEEIEKTMQEMSDKKNASQPVKEKTGGSTFKNPEGDKKAWELIDEAGLRGYEFCGAKVSEQHTNFIVNHNNATATEIESLIEVIKARVFEKSGVMLETEIKIIGEFDEKKKK